MSRKRPTASSIVEGASAAFLRLNPHLSVEAGVAAPKAAKAPQAAKSAPAPPGRKAVREATRLEKCNKTEARFHREVLLRAPGRLVILPQPPRFFELKGGGTYTPDFLALPEGGPVHVFEVKGGYRGPGWEQGVERYRRAALEWDGRGFRFVMATWDAKDRQWRIDPWDGGGEWP
jgi:hypothetical protein